MLIFRFICAVMLATAMKWVLGQPEAVVLLEEIEEMGFYALIAGAAVGFFILSKRQGNGIFIGTLNGIWNGVLTIFLAAGLYLGVKMWTSVSIGLIPDFEAFLRVMSMESQPLIEETANYMLIGKALAASAVVGLVTEILRLCLRWSRKARGEEEPKQEARAGVSKAGGALS